jgi:DNA replication and repair protein RecF
VALTRLSLAHFRSYTDALIAPGSGFVILTGENGAGKTNVLEAVSLLSPGRGLRRASLSEMARSHGPGGFAVAATLALPLGGGGLGGGGASTGNASPDTPPHPNPSPSRGGTSGIELGTGTTPTAPERRQVRINGAPASANRLSEWLSILWLTPAMDRLFSESASGRRQFLDRLVLALQPGHAHHAARYEAAMRARNKLLSDPDTADASWLTALEAGMAEHGAPVADARERTVAALARRLEAQPEGPFARAGLRLDRWRPSPDPDEALRRELRDSRGRDAAAGRALVGPHRTDLLVDHLGKGQPAERCSTGEQKALLLAIVLAHADLVAERAGRRPILLLDEVAAHLDPSRRAALFARLAESGGQVWMTGTEASLFDAAPDACWLSVRDGCIHPT